MGVCLGRLIAWESLDPELKNVYRKFSKEEVVWWDLPRTLTLPAPLGLGHDCIYRDLNCHK